MDYTQQGIYSLKNIVKKKTLKKITKNTKKDDYSLQKSRTRNSGERRKYDFQNYHILFNCPIFNKHFPTINHTKKQKNKLHTKGTNIIDRNHH